GARFFVGRKVKVDVRQLLVGMADTVVDLLGQRAYEEAGEVAEGWPSPSKADNEDLEAALADAVVAWIDRRGLAPGFWLVRNVTEHRAPEIETVETAALKVLDVVHTLERPARHSDVYRVACAEVGETTVYGHAIEGFVTSAGRFVDRTEAAALARAPGQTRSAGLQVPSAPPRERPGARARPPRARGPLRDG